MHSAALSPVVSAQEAAGLLLSYLVASMIILHALSRLLREGSGSSRRGRVAYIAWGLACLWGTMHVGLLAVPVGGLACLARLRWRRRRLAAQARAAGESVQFVVGDRVCKGGRR